MFLTLEDETGPLNVIVWPKLFERFRRAVFSAGMMGVEGRLQKEGEVIHVIADRIVDLTPALRRIAELGSTGLRLAHGRGDEVRTGGGVDTRAESSRRCSALTPRKTTTPTSSSTAPAAASPCATEFPLAHHVAAERAGRPRTKDLFFRDSVIEPSPSDWRAPSSRRARRPLP
jgi:DNA polymerase III alpha subunit